MGIESFLFTYHRAVDEVHTPLARLGKMMAWIDENDPFPSVISDTTAQMLRSFGPYMRKFGFVLKHPKRFAPLLKKVLPRPSPAAGALLKTTIVFTMSGGSKASNVIPTEAWVIGNLRCAPHQTQQEYIDFQLSSVRSLLVGDPIRVGVGGIRGIGIRGYG